jgi:GR25 family glycosyltransferase involved in LPS biosynthesis
MPSGINFVCSLALASELSIILSIALFTGASVIGIVVGLAAQSTLSNMIAGLSLAIFQPFRVGDRLDFMKFKLKDFKYAISIWYGIDGYSVENINLFDTLKNTKIKSPGALGLLLTYRSLIDYCLEKNLERVIILEDDIYISDEFLNYDFKSLKEDVVYLGANQSNFSSEQLSQIENNSYYKIDDKNYTYGTYGISLSNSFLHKLKNELLNLQYPIDVLIYKLINNNGIVLYPNLVIPELRDSDNMGKRNLIEFSNKKKWDLTKYKDIKHYEIFISDFNFKKILQLTNNNNFVFIIPSYNNEKWVDKNIISVITQLYPLWRIIYIDDNSSDSTNKLVKKLADPEVFKEAKIGQFGEIYWENIGEIKELDGSVSLCEFDVSPEFVFYNSTKYDESRTKNSYR